jgi:hypothetical protein
MSSPVPPNERNHWRSPDDESFPKYTSYPPLLAIVWLSTVSVSLNRPVTKMSSFMSTPTPKP